MKKLIYTLPLVLLACGQSPEEIEQKRKSDSMEYFNGLESILDSIYRGNDSTVVDTVMKVIRNNYNSINQTAQTDTLKR